MSSLKSGRMAVALILSMQSWAAMASPGYTLSATMSYFNGRDNGLDFSLGGVSNPMACASYYTLRLPPAATNYATVASTLMMAYALGRKVQVYVYNCDTDGVGIIAAAQII